MTGLVDGNNFFVSCERVFDRTLVGRPVAVLSNNDGCCISRSNELKALGVRMGTPYFQLKDREASGEIGFRSSNFELYGDMSRRIISILRQEALDVEQYSIDEAFILPPSRTVDGGSREWLFDYGRKLRAKILRWTGIPCGIGFAPTKTLAKIANHIAKKRPEGVFILPEDPSDFLAALPSGEVWGVGRRLSVKLRAWRIFTAKDLRDAHDDDIKSAGGATLLKTARELRGIPCGEERDYDADPESISCSRSFGEPVTTIDGIAESVASFVAQAAEKLRRHGLFAAGCNIYAQTFHPGGGGNIVGRTVIFPSPTDATNVMLKSASAEIRALFAEGTRYRKTGMVFFGLEKAGSPRQGDLFESPAPTAALSSSPLYKAIDMLNARYGKDKVLSAAQGVGERPWHVKRQKLSKRSTTRWDELPVVK